MDKMYRQWNRSGISARKDDISFMLYTSGTTGNPKAAVHTHQYVRGHEPDAIFWSADHGNEVVSHIGKVKGN